MIEFQFLANILLVVLWILFLIYIVWNQKYIPINTLGLMVAVACIYPYILYQDIIFKSIPPLKFRYETLICRYLILITFYSFISGAKKLNNQLLKLSKKNKKFLKQNNDK